MEEPANKYRFPAKIKEVREVITSFPGKLRLTKKELWRVGPTSSPRRRSPGTLHTFCQTRNTLKTIFCVCIEVRGGETRKAMHFLSSTLQWTLQI